MRAPILALGLGVAGLVGFGVWLGRSSTSSTASPAIQTAAADAGSARVLAPAVVPARAARTPAPVLSARRTTTAPAPGLAADLVDADPRVRRAAVREAARNGDGDPAVFLAASRDRDVDVGAGAMDALGKLYAEGAVPLKEMVARATDHGLDPRVRVSALNGLGVVANGDAAVVLAELLARGDVDERRSAAILLAHQELAVAVPALIAALRDGDEYVRANALESLRGRARGRDFGNDATAWQAWWQARATRD